MECSEIKNKIQEAMPDATVNVSGDGYHYEVIVVTEVFSGLNRIARQKKIMGLFKQQILDGSLHALSIQAKTPQEWEERQSNG